MAWLRARLRSIPVRHGLLHRRAALSRDKWWMLRSLGRNPWCAHSPNHPMFFHDFFPWAGHLSVGATWTRRYAKDRCLQFRSVVAGYRRLQGRFETSSLWHNRHKQIRRVACLGEYYVDKNRHCGTGTTGDFEWRNYSQGAIDPTRYTMWYQKVQMRDRAHESIFPGAGPRSAGWRGGQRQCNMPIIGRLAPPHHHCCVDLKKWGVLRPSPSCKAELGDVSTNAYKIGMARYIATQSATYRRATCAFVWRACGVPCVRFRLGA